MRALERGLHRFSRRLSAAQSKYREDRSTLVVVRAPPIAAGAEEQENAQEENAEPRRVGGAPGGVELERLRSRGDHGEITGRWRAPGGVELERLGHARHAAEVAVEARAEGAQVD